MGSRKQSVPPDTWTESGQTPILREVSSSRDGHDPRLEIMVPDATGAETTEPFPRKADLFSADYVPASTPAPPARCRLCCGETTPEWAGQHDRCVDCWAALLAAQPDGRPVT